MYKLSKLLKSIRNASAELQTLVQDLDRFRSILVEVGLIAEKQEKQEYAPTPSTIFLATLKSCEERFQWIEQYASKVISSVQNNAVRKTWASLKIPVQKAELQRLRAELQQSTYDLAFLL